jgi:hypothetical protein
VYEDIVNEKEFEHGDAAKPLRLCLIVEKWLEPVLLDILFRKKSEIYNWFFMFLLVL